MVDSRKPRPRARAVEELLPAFSPFLPPLSCHLISRYSIWVRKAERAVADAGSVSAEFILQRRPSTNEAEEMLLLVDTPDHGVFLLLGSFATAAQVARGHAACFPLQMTGITVEASALWRIHRFRALEAT
jgi:hypothetical protein